MKTFKKSILVLMAVMAISLTSCKKDDDGGGGGGAASGTVEAKVADQITDQMLRLQPRYSPTLEAQVV